MKNFELIAESELNGVHNTQGISDIFAKYSHIQNIYLPIIGKKWIGWEVLDRCSQNFYFSIFQDEIREYLNLSNKISINILIYKPLRPSEASLIKELSECTHKDLSYTFLYNNAWFAEETFKSLPYFINQKIVICFNFGENKSILSSSEQKEFLKRAYRYLNISEISVIQNPLIFNDKEIIKAENITTNSSKSFSLDFHAIYRYFLVPLKSFKYLITTHPIIFFYSSASKIKYKYLNLRQKIITFWWENGAPIRKVYYVLKFHYENKEELPKKLLLVLKGKKKLW